MDIVSAWKFEATTLLDFLSVGFTLILHIKNFGTSKDKSHLSVLSLHDRRDTSLERDTVSS